MSDKKTPNKPKNKSANKTARNSEQRGRLVESTNPANKGYKQDIDTTGSTGPRSPAKKQ